MEKQKNFKAKLKGLISNVRNQTFLPWTYPYKNIREWFWRQEEYFEYYGERKFSRTFCRLVIDREYLRWSCWAIDPKVRWRYFDSALRGGGVIWRKKYTPFRNLPEEVRTTLREEWHKTWRVTDK